jgi:hypothetical protein
VIAGLLCLLGLVGMVDGPLIRYHAVDRDREIRSQADLRLVRGWSDLDTAGVDTTER